MPFELTGSWHNWYARQPPTMYMPKTFDAIFFISVASIPIGINSIIWAQVDPTKGRVAELKKNQRELAASTKGYTKAVGSTVGFCAKE